jgi:transposase
MPALPPRNQPVVETAPAETSPHSGSQPAATSPDRDRALAERRQRQVNQYLAGIAVGLTPSQSASASGRALSVVESLARRWASGGIEALRPRRKRAVGFIVERPDFKALVGRRPRRGPELYRWETNRRLLTLGRLLQLRAQGMGFLRASREIGCGMSTLARLYDRFKNGGLLNLEVKPSTGRPKLSVPPFALRSKIIRRVQRLAVAYAYGPERAWREFSKRPDCPLRLRAWLAARKSIPAAMLDAVRVKIVPAFVVEQTKAA